MVLHDHKGGWLAAAVFDVQCHESNLVMYTKVSKWCSE